MGTSTFFVFWLPLHIGLVSPSLQNLYGPNPLVSIAKIGASFGIWTLALKMRHCRQFLRAKVDSLAMLGNENCSFMSGLNYIDLLDESKSRCDCPARATFYIFSDSTPRLIDVSSTANRVKSTGNIQYKRHLKL